MPKFYLQSGTVSYVVCAVDREGAALWAMHRTMDTMAEVYQAAKDQWYETDLEDELAAEAEDSLSAGLTEDDQLAMGIPAAIPYDAMLEGLGQFHETIRISEIGFGRSEAGELETETIFHKWRQLMLAVDRLHRGRQGE